MKLYIYANFNVLGNFYSTPIAEKITPEEMQKDYIQIVAGLDPDTLNRLKECDLYCLGEYDNITGVIVPKVDFILHCSDACNKFLNPVNEEGEAVHA